jgi:hypothetical protein
LPAPLLVPAGPGVVRRNGAKPGGAAPPLSRGLK